MNLFIRNFPNEIHKALKVRAAQEDKSLSTLIIEALEELTHDKKIRDREIKTGGKA